MDNWVFGNVNICLEMWQYGQELGYDSLDIGGLLWQCRDQSEGHAFWIFSGYFVSNRTFKSFNKITMFSTSYLNKKINH